MTIWFAFSKVTFLVSPISAQRKWALALNLIIIKTQAPLIGMLVPNLVTTLTITDEIREGNVQKTYTLVNKKTILWLSISQDAILPAIGKVHHQTDQ